MLNEKKNGKRHPEIYTKITRTILLPTDFSSWARNAVQYALSIFKDQKSRFILFHSNPAYTVQDFMCKESDLKLHHEVQEVIKTLDASVKSNISFEYYSGIGEPVDAIYNYCKLNEVDYIVMGANGMRGLQKFVLSSLTSDVIECINVPVITVPVNAKYHVPQNIAFALDLKSQFDEENFSPLIEIVNRYNSNISIISIANFHFGTVEAEQRFRLKEIFGLNLSAFIFLKEENLINGLEEFIEENHIDMVAVLPKETNFLYRLFRKNLTIRLSINTRLPVLSLNNSLKYLKL